MDAPMKLVIWGSGYGLPTFDHGCLAVIAYSKISGVPLKLSKEPDHRSLLTTNLPVLLTEQGTARVSTWQQIINHLQYQGFSPDAEFSDKQKADITAFIALVEQKLKPAVLHTFWMDGKNFTDITRGAYAKCCPLPMNYITPVWLHSQAKSTLDNLYGGLNSSPADVEKKIYKDARVCLNLLSSALGENDFFFGKTPSSADAMIFSYLAALLKIPLPSARLQTHIKGCENLCRYVDRFLKQFMPPDPDQASSETQDLPKTNPSFDIDEDPHKRRNQILSGVVAVVAMVAYALMSGLVRIEIDNSDDAENDDDNLQQEEAFEQFNFTQNNE